MLDHKVDSTTFKWTIGILVTTIMAVQLSIITYTSGISAGFNQAQIDNSGRLSSIEIQIKTQNEELSRQRASIDSVYKTLSSYNFKFTNQ